MIQQETTRKDFFISYTGADRLWAEWIAWQLEEAGYSIVFQESFPSGEHFVQKMKTAFEETNNTLAVLSPDYMAALSRSDEWTEILSGDPLGRQRTLIPVQIRETRNQLKSVLALLSYTNLVGLDEQQAREVLLASISQVSHEPIPSSQHALVTTNQPRFPDLIPPIWNVPFARNPYFTDREESLSQLAKKLQAGKIMSVAQHPHAISGLGGIGKTQLALEYAYRYSKNYEAVFWVTAESREALTAGYTNIAQQLELLQYNEHDQSVTILAVKQWLQGHLNWLLILDNADDLTIVPEFLPSAPSGHIILTTRAFSMGSLAQRLDINTLPLDEGILFLLRRAGLIKPDSTLQEARSEDIAQARNLVQELGGLPLALDQAGAYIEETGCSLQDYVHLYRRHSRDLLSSRGSLVESHPEPVTTTWALAFENVAESNPASVDLLQLCAFLASEDIPEELITGGSADLDSALKSVVDRPIAWNTAIATLLKYSLIQRNSAKKTLSIHRLVQAVLRNNMDEPTSRQWAERAVRIVNRAFPSGEFETWPQCEHLLPHALRCVDSVDHYQLLFPEVVHLLGRTGYYLSERARYQEAEVLRERALVASRELFGSFHIETATSLNNLAQLYVAQGRYEEAEPLYLQALAIREEQLGASHPNIATSLNNLAQLYVAQGRYEEAEPLYERALIISEEQLGAEHPDTALSMNNLADLYQAQGKYDEAKPLYERALAIREQVLGSEHPDTATSLDDLAQLYSAQDRYEEAEPLYQQALTIREQTLGPGHPDTAVSLNNLANLYHNKSKYEEAKLLYERSLAVFEQALGPEHPYTAVILGNLAQLYQDQGQYEQAGLLYQRALPILEQTLGFEHPDTAIHLNKLADLYRDQGQYEQAELLYQQSLTSFEQALGTEHPYTAMVKQRLTSLREKEEERAYQPEVSNQQESSDQEHHIEASDV